MKDEETIQALKENEKPFGLMSQEMQEKAREIQSTYDGTTLFDYYAGDGEWRGASTPDWDRDIITAYRLRSDYTEEPEKVHVRMIRSNETNSPVSICSIDADVIWYANKPYVSLGSLKYANRSIAAAEAWLKKLGVWGDMDAVKAILKGNETTIACESTEEPEVVVVPVTLVKEAISGLQKLLDNCGFDN